MRIEWCNGTISDKRWNIVAIKADTNVGTVVSIWAALLEYASRQEDYGSLEGFDGETIDALYGYKLGTSVLVYEALKKKGLITQDDRIAGWENVEVEEDEYEDENGYSYTRRYPRFPLPSIW